MKIQWNLTFQKCDSSGGYFGNDDWFDVTVFANSKSEAVDKAKKITECKYIRGLKCKAVELAEWLEELKALRHEANEFRKAGYKHGHSDGYNKAIDDFKKMMSIEKIKEYAESDGFINLNNCSLMIYDIAEQLKAGGKNGN